MSQDRLAELAGVPQPYISKVELQRNDILGFPDVLDAIAKVLGLQASELMEEVQFEHPGRS